jgi:hypothetical protein
MLAKLLAFSHTLGRYWPPLGWKAKVTITYENALDGYFSGSVCGSRRIGFDDRSRIRWSPGGPIHSFG